ncbi:MAG TPA: Gfo/Idh/MocA family oxidoreductase [Ktedonobacteraceae bacterium]|nr:Gfo/Idh/MocA family oxidoreductase [Ktedonobacteraceae bacterium]
MHTTLNWGIIGTGRIAHVFAEGIAQSDTGTLVAVGSRTQEAAEVFGETWHVPHRFGSYAELLKDNDVQAVYISTPHPLHAEWAIKAAAARKHILCEKPLTLNYAQAQAVIEAARKNDVFLMEAFMYRCHPQTEKLVELIRSGVIGQVRVIQATFCFRSEDEPDGRLLNNALGGGGILDVGGYCASIARLIAGAAIGQRFSNPVRVVGTGYVGNTHVDEYAIASLSFPGNIIAQLFSGVRVNGGSKVHIYGTEGSIYVPSPFTPRSGEALSMRVKKDGGQEAQDIFVENTTDLYALEADTVARYITERQAPAIDWEDTLGNMHTLDLWRKAVGVVYADDNRVN